MTRSPRMAAVVSGSLIGTTIEWYDFFLYGSAAALVFNKLFFPAADPLMGTLLAFATYAVGFVARPIGAVVFGHFGDRYGRKATLVASLLLMGGSTFLISLLPTYAAIGVAAPLILTALRLVQGFALGGEWGGAVLLVAEYGNDGRRGFWASWPNVGPPAGNLLAAGVLAVLSAALPADAFLSWGWRIPFALSALLLVVGLWLRLYVAETPLFQQSKAPERMPLGVVVRRYPRQVLLAAFSRFGENASYYIFTVFVLTYVTEVIGLPRSVALTAVLIGAAVECVLIPMLGALSDRVGRRPIYIAASVSLVIWSFVFFALLDTAQPWAAVLAVVGGLATHALYSSVIGAFFSELFGTNVRYSGISVGYNLASVLAGSLAPIIALGLYERFQTGQAIAVYLAVMALISLLATLAARETRTVDLATVGEETPVRPHTTKA